MEIADLVLFFDFYKGIVVVKKRMFEIYYTSMVLLIMIYCADTDSEFLNQKETKYKIIW